MVWPAFSGGVGCTRGLGRHNDPMLTKEPTNKTPEPSDVLRPDIQALVVLIVAVLLAGIAAIWWADGGFQGHVVEIDKAASLTARFEVDVNTADESELKQLPGIGPTLSRRIVELRATSGPFRRVNDLDRVKGIGAKKIERMRPYLCPFDQDVAR